MSDIVQRLRTGLYGTHPIITEAADEIERLRADAAKLSKMITGDGGDAYAQSSKPAPVGTGSQNNAESGPPVMTATAGAGPFPQKSQKLLAEEKLLRDFADQNRSGAQGCFMEWETAQALAQAIDAILFDPSPAPLQEEGDGK